MLFRSQTTYTETATRDALDRMLFIEAERMAACLYDPEDCESERTVIISELQGSENDPDQVLDQEVIAAALRAHPYRHPTIGWLSDLQTMTRDDVLGHYRRYYAPNNATLVVVGDVERHDVLARVERHFGALPARPIERRVHTREPEAIGERRVRITREGTTAYLKVAYHAPAFGDPDFFAMLVLDAVLTGAKGLSLWASFRTPPPQRRARLYRALVDQGLASAVQGGVVPTADPYLYTVSVTVSDGVSLSSVEDVLLAQLDAVRGHGIDPGELARAKRQLRARMVFEGDSIANIAHQLGYFDVIADWRAVDTLPARIEAVTIHDVAAVAAARLVPRCRTVGWFEPVGPSGRPGEASSTDGVAE